MIPWPGGSGSKDLALQQLRRRLELRLRSDPWPRKSACHGEVKKGGGDKRKINAYLKERMKYLEEAVALASGSVGMT